MTNTQPQLNPETAVAVGRIVAPHGVHGELKVEPLTDFPRRFEPGSRLWLAGREVRVAASRPVAKLFYVKLEGIEDRDAAAAVRGQMLEAPEPQTIYTKDVYYQHDIIGLTVATEDGEELGKVESIFTTGVNDVYVVRGERGELLLPAVADVIKEVDLRGGRLVIDLIPGLEFTRPAPKAPLRARRPRRRRPASPPRSAAQG